MTPDIDWQQIADRYEPAGMPPRGELDGLVVVIDPVGGGAPEVDSRRADDLALMTGLHLFHLVQAAGGVPVMTRADGAPVPDQHGDDSAWSSCPRCADADVVVSIRFTPGSSTATNTAWYVHIEALGDDDLSRALVRALAGASGADSVEALQTDSCAALFAVGLSGVSVSIEVPFGAEETKADAKLSRMCALQLYKGLASFAKTEKLDVLRRRNQRTSEGAPPGPVPRFIDTPTEREIETTARRIWPAGNLPVEKAAWFCNMFRRVSLSDRTFVHFEPRVTVDQAAVVVGGATNIACMRGTLADALRAVGIDSVRTEMRVLPEEGRLGHDRFGVCAAPMALTYVEPSASAGLQTQLQHDEPVLLLDAAEDHLLVHAADGYWGWVRANCIRLIPEDEFNHYVAADGGGHRGDMERGAVSDRIRAALDLLHRPYLFGGISPLGLDCSGLVKSVFGRTGMALGRDAAQQFMQGRLVATRWHRDNIRAGDLLFLINPCGRIFHVAIALSQTHYVHAAAPEVQITSLQKGDRLYNEAREHAFFAARRL